MLQLNKKNKKAPDVPSPCIGICSMDEENVYCRGCYRTRDEIGGWVLMSRDEKLALLEISRTRRKAARRANAKS